MSVISLNGEWKIKGIDPEGKKNVELAGVVPGQVHTDLVKAGIIPDPFWRDQAEQCQWVENWDWHYSRSFVVPEDFDITWVEINFEGLDTFATIILNGEDIAQTANMLVPQILDVSNKLKHGLNHLEVRFAGLSKSLEGKPWQNFSAAFTADRVYARKMQCTFGWDWVHRLVSAGIWQPVSIVSYKDAHLTSTFVHTLSISDNKAQIAVEVSAESKSTVDLSANVSITAPDGSNVWNGQVRITGGIGKANIDIDNPQLWWPNGYGDHPLYTCNVSLKNGSEVLDSDSVEFGIRTIAIEEIDDEVGTSLTICINGKRIFAKGGNWVPADAFPATITPERYDRLISLAKEANVNLLRCWGGGLYEPKAFWGACNKYGVMISQDFLLACAEYPENDPVFMTQLKEEYAKAIVMLRNHPSLIMWYGDNELGLNSTPDVEYPGKKIAREISGPLCAKLDPSRPFRATSPFGGTPNNCLTSGDCHTSAWYDPSLFESDMSDYRERINNTVGRFMSEHAVPGAPPMRSLRKFMTDDDIRDGDGGQIWEYHTNDNPYNGVEITHYKMLEMTAGCLFGTPKDNDTRIAQMGYAHYEWIKLAVEAARRKKPYCRGIQFWMYNDCWPASGWSVVDYYGYPKAGYYAMKRVFKPLIVSVDSRDGYYNVWICNDLQNPVSGELDITVQSWSGEAKLVRHIQFTVPEDTSQTVIKLPADELAGLLNEQSVLVCDLTSYYGTDRALYYDHMPYKMQLPKANLTVTRADSGDGGILMISSDSYARVVTLDADADFSDNYFDLLPGESRAIAWTNPAKDFDGKIDISCWNC